jgi:hypothetical protein
MLNSVFSKADFTLDEGEVLLKDLQDMRDELTRYGDFVQSLSNQSREIIPLKQRKTNVSRPLNVTAICSYKQNNVSTDGKLKYSFIFLCQDMLIPSAYLHTFLATNGNQQG